MDNVLNALAGAFLLNAVHLPSLRSLYDMELVKEYIELSGSVSKKSINHVYRLGPDDFQRFFNETEACALENKPVRFPWRYLMETRLLTYRHPRDAIIEKKEASKSQDPTELRSMGRRNRSQADKPQFGDS